MGGAQSLKAVSAFLMVVPGVRLLAHGLFGPLPLVWSAELNSLDLKYVFNLYLSYTSEYKFHPVMKGTEVLFIIFIATSLDQATFHSYFPLLS